MKIKLKKNVNPFKYSKFGKVWRIKDDADIPKEVFDRLKNKVTKIKEKKEVENG